MKQNRREVELVVISDVHLGTYGCQAKELVNYLKSIQPQTLILNGDIIDIWQFKKRYWPKSHMKVIKHLINFASKGSKVIYITGNHDETFRRFEGLELGNLKIVNKYELLLNGKKAWFFHGDVFDVVMQNSKWLAVIGSVSYDLLIRANHIVNSISKFLGKGKVSFSKKIKENVKSAVTYINAFEETAAKIAIEKGFDYIICGHIHKTENRIITVNNKQIQYLNSGDWVENLSSLEYNKGKWKVYNYSRNLEKIHEHVDDIELYSELDNKQIFNKMYQDFLQKV